MLIDIGCDKKTFSTTLSLLPESEEEKSLIVALIYVLKEGGHVIALPRNGDAYVQKFKKGKVV